MCRPRSAAVEPDLVGADRVGVSEGPTHVSARSTMSSNIDRRTFLQHTAGAAVGGTVLAGSAQGQSGAVPQTDAESLTTDRCGADCMVDVIKGLGLEYLCA